MVKKKKISIFGDQHLLEKEMPKLKVNDIDIEVEDGLIILKL